MSTPVLPGARIDAMNANTARHFAGSITAMIGTASLDSETLVARDVALVLHESAHAFDARDPGSEDGRWPAEDAGLVASYPVEAPENNAWGRIEGAMLPTIRGEYG
jgi:hypothetical protein